MAESPRVLLIRGSQIFFLPKNPKSEMKKQVRFSDIVSIRHIAPIPDADTKKALFYSPLELRRFARQESADDEKRRLALLVQQTAQVRARTAKILERRRARVLTNSYDNPRPTADNNPSRKTKTPSALANRGVGRTRIAR